MKKFRWAVFPVMVSFFLASVALAQVPVKDKKFEFSTSACMNYISSGAGGHDWVINLPMRLGFFVFKGLEIEPEVLLTIPKETEGTGYFANLNVAYNFRAAEKVYPFILAGGGYGNGTQFWGVVIDREMGVTALNLGAGIKVMVGNSAALRLEYRFCKLTGQEDRTYGWGYYSYSYTDKVDLTYHNALIGISLFF